MALPIPVDTRHAAMAAALKDLGTGKSLSQIALDTGVDDSQLRVWLLRSVPDEYKELQELGLIQKIIDADKELASASNILEMHIADRKCKYARFDAERRLPHLFSLKQEIKHSGEVKVVFDESETARRLAFVMASAQRKSGLDLGVIDVEPIVETADDLF